MLKYVSIILVALIVSIGLIGTVSYFSAYNKANSMEQQIKATFENNKNVLSGYTNSIAEAAQIPAMQRDDLSKIYTDVMTGRYGENGSKALFQFINEQNPNVNSEVYAKLQTMIEAGRAKFTTNQEKLIDQKRSYETNLGSAWTGMFMHMAGYPKINLDDYITVVNNTTIQTYQTGIDDAMKLR